MKLKRTFSKDTYFISDNHFGHKNIIEYCDRPFTGNKEMTNKMINNWNAKAPINKDIFCVEDMFLSSANYAKQILSRLNGKIHLVVGNHEDTILKNDELKEMFAGRIYDIAEIKINDDELDSGHAHIIMCHYPMLSWNKKHYGSVHLFGHVHNSMEHPSPNAVNLCVEVNDYTPLSYHEIKTKVTKANLNAVN